MRIIAGKFGGLRLEPKGLDIRPTTDRAKEGLFNILQAQNKIENKIVLDLFCGSGNISFEFISRQAQKVVSVDIQKKNISFIKKQQNALNLKNLAVFQKDTFKYLEENSQLFDIVFADPPYAFGRYQELLDTIFFQNLLNPQALIILEHPKKMLTLKTTKEVKLRCYGQSCFSFIEN